MSTLTKLGLITSLALMPLSCYAASITWYQSGFDEAKNGITEWVTHPAPKIENFDHSDYRVLPLDSSKKLQAIDGFGTAFSEKSWDVISALPAEQKDKVIKSLFDAKNGLNFIFGRIPVGANDFSMDYYSLNDHPGDYEMKHFSIERDQKYLIPFIKAAQQLQPNMQFIASPWTPPAWMKANQHYACKGMKADAHLIWQPETEKAYALYLSKFVQAYDEQGIKIAAMHLQNEPAACQDFPSSMWSGEQMRDFLRDYLIPQFEHDKLATKAWLGTINYGDYESYAKPVLEDTVLRKKLGGVGYQWDGKYAIAETQRRYPDVKLVQTESECGDGSNDIFAGFYTFSLIKKYLEGGASQYFYWNTILDAASNSTWGWKQNALISVDRATGNINWNFEYTVMKHVSSLVKPGAHLLDMPNNEDALAFVNPNGEIVVILANPTYSPKTIRLQQGDKMMKVALPMLTINSLVIKS